MDTIEKSVQSGVGELDRRTYLGSSDVAGILGVSPWKTPLDVYLAKIGEPETITPERQRLFNRGKRLEPIAIDMMQEEYPNLVITKRSTNDAPNRYIDPEFDFMAAEIDFEWDDNGSIENGEIKTVHPFSASKWGEVETDQVPIEYAAQVMYGLMVTGRKKTLFGTLIGADTLLPFWILRDEETIDAMRAKCVRFWHERVLARVPPDPVDMGDMMRLFSRINGRAVEADEPMLDLIQKLRQVRGSKSAMEAEAEEIEFQIADMVRRQWGITNADQPTVDDAVISYGGTKVCTWKKQSRVSLDTKSLTEKHPEIAREFQKTSWFRVMRPAKPK